MGRNKEFRKRLASLEAQLTTHYLKVANEQRKPQPNKGRMDYWQREIRGRLKEINHLRHKLGLPERQE